MAENFQSDFVFGLQGNQYQEFINKIAKPIIQRVIHTNDYEIIIPNHHLSFKDFENRKNSIFPEFYHHFLSDIAKKDNQISFKIKVCISFDKRLCKDTCPSTGRKITTIKIAGIELAYFILFDIQEFFDFIYQNNDSLYQDEDSHIKKGYIHNINNEKQFSFIRTSVGDGIPLYHDRYDILTNLVVGDFVELFFESNNEKYPTNIKYSLNQDEIPNVVKRFYGELVYPDNQDCAFINTEEGVSIYIRPKLAESYYLYEEETVECLAIQDDLGRWKAELILIK